MGYVGSGVELRVMDFVSGGVAVSLKNIDSITSFRFLSSNYSHKLTSNSNFNIIITSNKHH